MSTETQATNDPAVLQEDFTLLVKPQPIALVEQPSIAAETRNDLLWIGAVVPVVLIVAWLAWRGYRRLMLRQRLRAAQAIAMEELARWRGLNDPEKVREAVTEVSATVRRYVKARYDLRAPEMTTEEFWQAQSEHRKVPEIHDLFWSAFMSETDPVKYAGLDRDLQAFEQVLGSAIGFVREAA